MYFSLPKDIPPRPLGGTRGSVLNLVVQRSVSESLIFWTVDLLNSLRDVYALMLKCIPEFNHLLVMEKCRKVNLIRQSYLIFISNPLKLVLCFSCDGLPLKFKFIFSKTRISLPRDLRLSSEVEISAQSEHILFLIIKGTISWDLFTSSFFIKLYLLIPAEIAAVADNSEKFLNSVSANGKWQFCCCRVLHWWQRHPAQKFLSSVKDTGKGNLPLYQWHRQGQWHP